MEPKSLNTLVVESEKLKKTVQKNASKGILKDIEHLFSDNSFFFDQEVIANWRRENRFDELIDYIIYQYSDRGGEELWKQVLLDLRIIKDDQRCFRLLDGLLPGRKELLKVALKNEKKYPNNYLISAEVGICKGEVLKLYYEYAYIVENRAADEVDKALSKRLQKEVKSIIAG